MQHLALKYCLKCNMKLATKFDYHLLDNKITHITVLIKCFQFGSALDLCICVLPWMKMQVDRLTFPGITSWTRAWFEAFSLCWRKTYELPCMSVELIHSINQLMSGICNRIQNTRKPSFLNMSILWSIFTRLEKNLRAPLYHYRAVHIIKQLMSGRHKPQHTKHNI